MATHTEYSDRFAVNVRDRLAAEERDVAWLARRVAMNRGTLANQLRGGVTVPVDTLMRVADAFGVDPSELVAA